MPIANALVIADNPFGIFSVFTQLHTQHTQHNTQFEHTHTDISRGVPVSSVPIANALVIADDPFGISVFSDRQLAAWQAAHGPLPEELVDFLQGGCSP